MSCQLERLKLAATPAPPAISSDKNQPSSIVMNYLAVETEDTFASLLELAANNDVEGFKQSIERDPSCVDENWTMVILSLSYVDVNRSCGADKSTALHCAASGGALNAADVVKLLLAAGADCNVADANGHRPIDVIAVLPKLQDVRLILEELLAADGSHAEHNLRVSIATMISNSPPLSPSMENGSLLPGSDSPTKAKLNDAPLGSEKREYPVDPSLPDIKNSIYSTDEFRMYSFKVRPCSRAYSHDWTECPFVHPGENARRRDPRKFHYSCVPCPDFRKGACRRGDMCEYAHGVFECWLHPAQYRTRLCKDGTNCARRVCFFAHTVEELRPLYVSTGSAVPSPRSSTSAATAMDFAAAMNLLSGSPSSIMSPSPFTPPMSPSANGIPHSSVAWPQPNVPALHLPGSNLQSSRLRSSLNARDISADYNLLPDFDVQQQQLLSELSSLTQPSLNNNSMNHSGRLKTLTPSNLDDLFSAESSSPHVLNQFQQQQSMLSPINTNFSPKNVDHPLLQASFASGRMSPRNVEPISPMSSRVTMMAQREKQLQKMRSLSSRELGSNAAAIVGSPPVNTLSKWGSSVGKPDWTLSTCEQGKLCRSNSFELGNGDGPDLSWVQSLVKESPTEMKDKLKIPVSGGIGASASPSESTNMNSQIESIDLDNMVGSWVEHLQIDQLVAQQN
ncbi:hypothetical protein OIU78_003544 [Salix suchowensis]|nr:hypothetical protein OIU78_003544 [Salix suchowensis]